jgi:hypothetical protein
MDDSATCDGWGIGPLVVAMIPSSFRVCSIITEHSPWSGAGLADNSSEGDSWRMSPWLDQEGTLVT